MPTDAGGRASAPRRVDDFLASLTDGKKIVTAAIAGLAPIIASLAGLAPPEPQHLAEVAALLAAFACMINYQVMSERTTRQISRTLKWSGAVCAVAFAAYGFLFVLFTYSIPTTGERIVLGCIPTSVARLAATELPGVEIGCPGDFEPLLAGARFDPHRLWTSSSLALVTIVLVLSWVVLAVAISVGVSCFTYLLRQPARE